MYLKRLHIEHNGPIKQLALELPFTTDGLPKPLVIVGQNGSGKTNLLSIIADAIIQAAGTHYTDLLPGTTALERPFFRVVGGSLTTLGSTGGFSILQFEDEGTTFLFKEKSGQIVSTEVLSRLEANLHAGVAWPDAGNIKEFAITKEQAEKVFEKNVYAYFPASRAESPNWLNEEKLPEEDETFDLSTKYQGRLGKPVYIKKCMSEVQQWLLSLVMDSRLDFSFMPDAKGQFQMLPSGDIPRSIHSLATLNQANQILQKILGNETARFVWLGRHSGNQKLGISSSMAMLVPNLSALSSGQSSLLSIFGTILRYADRPEWALIPLSEISGICLIDEIDAHMHVDLQYRAIPELIKLFPKIQFILSSHSPLFALGMDKTFGANGITIVDMPSGMQIQAETYTEFGKAIEAVQGTKAFAEKIEAAVSTQGKLLVFMEGETDPIYLKTAAEVLGQATLFDDIEYEWVGAKDQKSGQAFNTGKDALNSVFSFLRANPGIVKRPVLLLYDNDARKPSENCGSIYIRCVQNNPDNSTIMAGIENLLPTSVITDDMYDVKNEIKPNGTKSNISVLNKMRLCQNVCTEHKNLDVFQNFSEVIDIIESVVALCVPNTQIIKATE